MSSITYGVRIFGKFIMLRVNKSRTELVDIVMEFLERQSCSRCHESPAHFKTVYWLLKKYQTIHYILEKLEPNNSSVKLLVFRYSKLIRKPAKYFLLMNKFLLRVHLSDESMSSGMRQKKETLLNRSFEFIQEMFYRVHIEASRRPRLCCDIRSF